MLEVLGTQVGEERNMTTATKKRHDGKWIGRVPRRGEELHIIVDES